MLRSINKNTYFSFNNQLYENRQRYLLYLTIADVYHEPTLNYIAPSSIIFFPFIQIYNISGELMQTIPVYNWGTTSIEVLGGQLQAGTYMYTLVADDLVADFKKMVLTK